MGKAWERGDSYYKRRAGNVPTIESNGVKNDQWKRMGYVCSHNKDCLVCARASKPRSRGAEEHVKQGYSTQRAYRYRAQRWGRSVVGLNESS